jgi:hypothetical protein
MKTALFAAALVMMTTTMSAEERRIDWKPTAALVAGQAFDVWTTQHALGRGCREGNAGLYGAQPSTGRLVAMKTVMVLPAALAGVWLQKGGHPRLARAIGYGAGSVGVMAGAMNLALACGSR